MADEAQPLPVMSSSNSEVEDNSDFLGQTTPQTISYFKSTFDAAFARMGSEMVSRENLLRRELEMQKIKNKRIMEVEALLLIREERLKREIERKRNEIESINQEHERERLEMVADLENLRNEMLELREKDLLLEQENAALKSQINSLESGKKKAEMEVGVLKKRIWGLEKGVSKWLQDNKSILMNGDEDSKPSADNIASAEVLMCSSNGKRKRVSEASPKSENASSRGLEKSSTKTDSEKDVVHNLPSDEDLKDAISDILRVVDFDTTTSTDIKKQLALKFKTDFTEKFPLIKIMIHKEIEKSAKAQDHKVKDRSVSLASNL